MLRHRVIQQCARLALSIPAQESISKEPLPKTLQNIAKNSNSYTEKIKQSLKNQALNTD
jgi:hypothetical protein